MFVVLHQDTRHKVVQKYPLPRVLTLGQSDTNEADNRRFFVDAVNKSVHDAMLNHNTAFLNTSINTMKEVFHGYTIDLVDQAGTSHKEVALASNDDVQAVQSPSDQIQGNTTNQLQYNPRPSVQHVQ